jgi:putative DNA primase/helicase
MTEWIEDSQRATNRARARCKVAEMFGVEPHPDDLDLADGPKVKIVTADDVASEGVEWLWPGRIPLGMLALFSGDPKLGKSLAALSLIAAVSRGGPLPGPGDDGPVTAAPGSAILLSAEDDAARTIFPRLRAAGADLERVKVLKSIIEPGFQGDPYGPDAQIVTRERMPTALPHDLQVIETYAAELGDCRLIVFDPISAYLGRNVDAQQALAPLRDMAERLNATVLLITHHNKRGANGTNGKYRVLNSIGYVAGCRVNFMFLEDPDDPTGRRRLMLDNGTNLAAQHPALAYVIRDDGAGPFCDWLPETIELDANAALDRAAKAAKPGAAAGMFARRRECQEWLRGYLADGPKPATECERAAMAAGFTRSVLLGARAALAVRCVRSGFGKGACYHWHLPEIPDESAAHP